MTAKALIQMERGLERARVFLVDDEALVRTALRISIEHHPEFIVVGEAADERSALEGIQRIRPDVLITDLNLQHGDGVALINRLRRGGLKMRILVFSAHEDAFHITRALAAGAQGYVLKQDGTHKLIEALQLLLSGRTFLSERVMKYVSRSGGSSPFPPLDSLGKR